VITPLSRALLTFLNASAHPAKKYKKIESAPRKQLRNGMLSPIAFKQQKKLKLQGVW